MQTWSLGKIVDLGEQEKAEWFVSTFLDNCVFKMVSSGSPQAQRVRMACELMIEEWEAATATADIGDFTADAMEAVLRCCRVLISLVGCDIANLKDDSWSELDHIGKLRHSAAEGIDASLAVSIAECEWYNMRLSNILEYRPVVQRIGEQFVLDTTFWNGSSGLWCDVVRQEVVEATTRLCAYAKDLPIMMAKPLMDVALYKLKATITNAIEVENSTRGAVDLGALQAVMCEAHLAFSLDSCLDELRARVAMVVKDAATVSIETESLELLKKHHKKREHCRRVAGCGHGAAAVRINKCWFFIGRHTRRCSHGGHGQVFRCDRRRVSCRENRRVLGCDRRDMWADG